MSYSKLAQLAGAHGEITDAVPAKQDNDLIQAPTGESL
jgi:hypothetical protein